MPRRPPNFPINHVGLSIPNLDTALAWYTSVLGFRQMAPVIVEDAAVSPSTVFFKIMPPGLTKVKMVYLATGNGVGLELFEFVEPRVTEEEWCEPSGGEERTSGEKGAVGEVDGIGNGAQAKGRGFSAGRDWNRGGLFHMAVTVPDVPEMCEKVVKSGGRRVAELVTAWGEEGLYVEDPWGNGLELLSCSFEMLLGNRVSEGSGADG